MMKKSLAVLGVAALLASAIGVANAGGLHTHDHWDTDNDTHKSHGHHGHHDHHWGSHHHGHHWGHHNHLYVTPTETTENGMKVKVFDIGNISNHSCMSENTKVKYFEDGSIHFDSMVECEHGYTKTEDDVEMEVDFLSNHHDRQLFDKEFTRKVHSRNQKLEWLQQEHSNAKLADLFNETIEIRVDFDD